MKIKIRRSGVAFGSVWLEGHVVEVGEEVGRYLIGIGLAEAVLTVRELTVEDTKAPEPPERAVIRSKKK